MIFMFHFRPARIKYVIQFESTEAHLMISVGKSKIEGLKLKTEYWYSVHES